MPLQLCPTKSVRAVAAGRGGFLIRPRSVECNYPADMNTILLSAFQIASSFRRGANLHATDVIHFGATHYHSPPSSSGAGATSMIAAAGTLAVAGVAAAAALKPVLDPCLHATMDYVRSLERVKRVESGAGMYLRPLGQTMYIRRTGPRAFVVSAKGASGGGEAEVSKIRLPASYEAPPQSSRAFVRFRLPNDEWRPERADCLFVKDLGWFVVVQRLGRVYVGVARYVQPEMIAAVDAADSSAYFVHLARVTGAAAS